MLTIRNIRQGDGGTYTCKATNKAGSQERELFLKVFGKDTENKIITYDNHMTDLEFVSRNKATYYEWNLFLDVKERCMLGIISPGSFEN